MPHVASVSADCKTIALRDYQTEPATLILEALSRKPGHKVLAVAPVGFGKTVLFSYVASKYAARGKKVLILAHREELLDQIGEKISAFGLTRGLEKAKAKVDTNALPEVTIASVQTLRGARLERFDASAFDLIVVDEAHHVRKGDQYAKVFARFPSASVLGVTGTPKRLDGQALGDVFEEVAVTIGLDEGIRSGWLCTPSMQSYHIKGYKLDTVKVTAGDYNAADVERELLVSPVLHAAANIVQEVSPGRRTLVFAPTVRAAEELSKELNRRGLNSLAVSGEMASADRKESTRRYRAGEVDIAVNCMLWTEGFDVPETDCVVLLRPTKSSALMTQMIGRGLRLHPGKADCLLVEIEPETVTKKLFARPLDVLMGAPGMTRQAKGVYDEKGAVEPGAQGVIESIDMDAEIARKSYEELMARVAAYKPSKDAVAAMKELGLTAAQIKSVRSPEHIVWWNRERARRRLQGLCSIKQMNLLARFGLNTEVSMGDASDAITTLKGVSFQKWRAPELYRDHRFVSRAPVPSPALSA